MKLLFPENSVNNLLAEAVNIACCVRKRLVTKGCMQQGPVWDALWLEAQLKTRLSIRKSRICAKYPAQLKSEVCLASREGDAGSVL